LQGKSKRTKKFADVKKIISKNDDRLCVFISFDSFEFVVYINVILIIDRFLFYLFFYYHAHRKKNQEKLAKQMVEEEKKKTNVV
jgi:predicted RNase H-related nuclease YkuK (DUF458 family)